MSESTLSQAYTFYRENLRNNALTETEAVLRADPANAEAHNLRGAVLEGMGRRQEALAAYEEAVRLNPAYNAALENARRLQNQTRPLALPTISAGQAQGASRLATLLTGLAGVAGVAFICTALTLFVEGTRYGVDFDDILGLLVVLVAGATFVLMLLAFARALRLLLSIENGTRQNSELLQQLLKGNERSAPPAESAAGD